VTNVVGSEEGVVGAALVVALIAMFVAALVVPSVIKDDGVLFGAASSSSARDAPRTLRLAGRGGRDLLSSHL
jgi:hypothetical protein